MRRKYKITGCARFLIFLLVFTPIVLIGVSYYNGNNPLEQIKELLNIEDNKPAPQEETYVPAKSETQESSGVSELSILQGKMDVIQERLDNTLKVNEQLERLVKDKDKEIQFLKQQLGNE